MHKLSPRTQELVRHLSNAPDIIDRLFSTGDRRFDVIRELAESGDTAAIPHLAPLLFNESELAFSAANAIAQLLGNCQSGDYIWLDEEVRQVFCWTARARQALPISDVPIDLSVTAIGVVSFHPNGRLRERAVKTISKWADSAITPFLLIRLNDWVVPVRVAARVALADQLERKKLDGFVKHLALVVRLLGCARDQHDTFVADVFKALWEDDAEALLGVIISHTSKDVRRVGYLQVLAVSGPARVQVIQAALRGNDPVLRLWAVREAILSLDLSELEKTLDEVKVDLYAPIRREVLRGYAEKYPARAESELTRSLLDRSAAVREYARFHLRQFGWRDFGCFYRQALESAAETTALAGLAETATKSDAAVFCRYMSAASGRQRQLAIRGIGRVSEKEGAKLLLVALQDKCTTVSREALRALLKDARGLAVGDLEQVIHSECPAHVRMAIIQLLANHWSWSAVPLLLELASDRDDIVATMARTRLTSRINRVFTSPSVSEQAAILTALDRCEAAGASQFANDYRRWIRTRLT